MISGQQVKRHRVVLAFMAVVLVTFAVLIFATWQVAQNRKTARQGQLAHDALCALNQRNIDRIAQSQEFLRDHPDGIPGIPVKLIKDGIKADSSTVAVLNRTLGECPPPTPPH